MPRVLRVVAGVLLGASGVLLVAASWQRWAGACGWGDGRSAQCLSRQDHRYDFLPVGAPWDPVGADAQLAGWSLLILAAAVLLVPWALAGRRPGLGLGLAVLGAVLSLVDVGVATLRSGLAGSVVLPVADRLAELGWQLVVLGVLVRLALAARGWRLAAAVLLVLATPLAATFLYAMGSYDSRPWWEAVSGVLTVAAGLCLLGDAVFGGRSGKSAGAGLREVTEPLGRPARP